MTTWYDADQIITKYNISLETLNNLIEEDRFPKHDMEKKDIKLWHRTTVEKFFRIYPGIVKLKRLARTDYVKRRKKYIQAARTFISEHEIRDPFEYVQKAQKISGAPTPSTLFRYSITFEELTTVQPVSDKVEDVIIRSLLEKNLTADELAMIADVSSRTIYRKIDQLKEKGYIIQSDHSGFSLNQYKIEHENVKLTKRKRLDLTGEKYGRLTVLHEIEPHGKYRRWACQCDCGNIIHVHQHSLRSGNTKSCGCLQIDAAIDSRLIDLTGKRFGKLVVIGKVDDDSSSRSKWSPRIKWLCQCDCGSSPIQVSGKTLKNGGRKSCGCNKNI